MTKFTDTLTDGQYAAFMIDIAIPGGMFGAAFVAICGGWWVVL